MSNEENLGTGREVVVVDPNDYLRTLYENIIGGYFPGRGVRFFKDYSKAREHFEGLLEKNIDALVVRSGERPELEQSPGLNLIYHVIAKEIMSGRDITLVSGTFLDSPEIEAARKKYGINTLDCSSGPLFKNLFRNDEVS